MSSTLIGVGVGPGDPELVTVKGVNALRGADVVVVPVMDTGERGRAEATVLHYVGAEKIVRVVFALNERTDRARREAAWDAAGERVAGLLREHAAVAFATTYGSCRIPSAANVANAEAISTGRTSLSPSEMPAVGFGSSSPGIPAWWAASTTRCGPVSIPIL